MGHRFESASAFRDRACQYFYFRSLLTFSIGRSKFECWGSCYEVTSRVCTNRLQIVTALSPSRVVRTVFLASLLPHLITMDHDTLKFSILCYHASSSNVYKSFSPRCLAFPAITQHHFAVNHNKQQQLAIKSWVSTTSAHYHIHR